MKMQRSIQLLFLVSAVLFLATPNATRISAQTLPPLVHHTDIPLALQWASVTAIAGGSQHTCVVTTVGSVKCWGLNNAGQLGDGTTTDRLTPVDVSGLTSGVSAIVAGRLHTCALMTNGGVKCWGYNGSGQLGDGTTTNRTTPVDVSGLTNGVSAIAAGLNDHTCAVMSSGGVKCWGRNNYGKLGDGTTTNRLVPVDVSGLTSGVNTIATGYDHTCAGMSSGGAKCWGLNDHGQLGDGTTTNSSTPVDVSGLTGGVGAIVAGVYHSCALTVSGGVQCWGWGPVGQTGDGSLTTGVTAIAAGLNHTCALMAGGGVKCWGYNAYGQLGNGTTNIWGNATPVDVSGLMSGVSAIGAGSDYSCAAIASGGIKCWGRNGSGALGDCTFNNFRTTPVDVVGFGGQCSLFLPLIKK
jgi:alpha-tubulin suppressor-like RCC1 family protein